MSQIMRFWYLLHIYASSEGSDEPVQPHNLARAFADPTLKVGTKMKSQAKTQVSRFTRYLHMHVCRMT